jgi:hypothetical protein
MVGEKLDQQKLAIGKEVKWSKEISSFKVPTMQ